MGCSQTGIGRYESLRQRLLASLGRRYQEFVDIRRSLHRIPEASRKEYKTAGLIAETLERARIEYATGVGHETGIVGLVGGTADGPTVALRAEMDGLPIPEETGLPYASVHPGFMHACGHDFHLASVLGAGILLSEVCDELPGRIKLIFQPAEEDGPEGGAAGMIRAGALDSPPVSGIFAMHVWPLVPSGKIAVIDGPVMASSDTLRVTILGSGGHAACPHQATDPINVAAHVIVALNSVVSRCVDPADGAVVTVGKIEGGVRRSVIPEQVTMEGTVRALDRKTRNDLRLKISRLCSGVAEAFGSRSIVDWEASYEATVNDPRMAAVVRAGVRRFMGDDRLFLEAKPGMASEDFSAYLTRVPGAMFWVGIGGEGAPALHSPTLTIEDEALSIGIQAFLGTVLEYLLFA